MSAHPFKDLIVKRKKGELIYREGDLGSEMFVVQSGSVLIFREFNDTRQELAIMEKGDFFGEFALLEGLPRTACAEAVENSELIEINSTTFDKMIRGNIEIAVRMLRKLSNRLQEAGRKIETLSRGGAVAKEDGIASDAVDTDRPTEAPPPPPDAPPSSGVQAVPQPIDDVEVPEGALGVLVLEGGTRHFPIIADTAIIGRYDPVTGTRPDIDLTQVDISRSISRRHARIVRQDGGFLISEEVGALNGTFLNGERLTTGKPAAIVSGDKIGLGMVSLVFKVSALAEQKPSSASGS